MNERLLITTRNRVILWDNGPKTVYVDEGVTKDNRYHDFYGITWDEKFICITERTLRHAEILIFNGELKLEVKGLLTIEIFDAHQIFYKNNKLYVTNPRKNEIVIKEENDEGKLVCRAVSWKEPEDTYLHLNSIWCDGQRFYVVEHRKKKQPKRIKILDLDFNPLGEIDISPESPQSVQLRGLHNIYIESSFLYTCSPEGLLQVDLLAKNSKNVVRSPKGLYMRGLARTKDYFFLGLSEMKGRGERDGGDSAVLVVDNQFKLVAKLFLRDTGGLHDIRAVDSLDLAHNGIKCPITT